MRPLVIIAILALASLTTLPSDAQEAPAVATRLPAVMTNPWRIVGVDPSDRGGAKAALEQIRQAMSNRYTTGGQNLTVTAGSPPAATINARKITDQIIAGNFNGQETIPLTVEPVWCSLMDNFVVFVAITASETGELLGLAHSAIPKTTWRTRQAGGTLAGLLQASLARTADEALRRRKPAADKVDSLHFSLNLGRALDRQDTGSAHCLGLTVAEQVYPNFTYVYPFGMDHRATVFRVLGIPSPKSLRPTRRLLAKWQPRVPPRAFPFTATLSASYAESVLGQAIAGPKESQWQWNLAGDQIRVTGSDALTAWLDAEKATLLHEDFPQVARVYHGWVYLDRGRAWGLKMNDRLYARVGEEWILGHVVKFFGPEENLVSPRGFPIREGAILYIRKNQRQARIGQEFRFDPKDFPAAWPPEARSNIE